MKLSYSLFVGLNLLILWLLVSCQPEIEPTLAINLMSGTEIPQSLVEMTLSSARPTTTTTLPIETASPIPSLQMETLLPPEITSTTTVTLTPLPTLAGTALESAIATLLANPMNCDVPCWWGAVPGITTIDEIKHHIAPYNFDISEYEYEDEGKQFTVLVLGIGYDEERNDFDIRIGYGFFNFLLIDVSAYSPPISEFLVRYGPPDEVWIETMNVKRETLPVRLNMVYLQLGMAVGYVVDGDILNDKVIGCFADDEKGQLRLIAPNDATSYRDFSPIFEVDRRYLLLEDATTMTMAEFMEEFSDPTQPQCIETPTDLWD